MAEIRHVLEKYAGVAIDVLEKNGQDFTVEDVIKVASFLLDTKIEQSKVAEYDDQGRIIARSFYVELDKMGGIAGTVVKTIGKGLKKSQATLKKGVTQAGEKLYGKYPANLYAKETTRQRAGRFLKEQSGNIALGTQAGAGGLATGAILS